MTAPVSPGALDAAAWQGAEPGSFHWIGKPDGAVMMRWFRGVFAGLYTTSDLEKYGWTYLGQVPTQPEHAALTQRVVKLEDALQECVALSGCGENAAYAQGYTAGYQECSDFVAAERIANDTEHLALSQRMARLEGALQGWLTLSDGFDMAQMVRRFDPATITRIEQSRAVLDDAHAAANRARAAVGVIGGVG